MASKGRACALKFIKYFLITFNFLTMIAGGCLLGLGVYYKIMTVEYAEIFRGGILSVPIFMIVVGGLLFCIGFMGCCGTMCEFESLLKIYLTVTIIILVLQIVTVIMFFALRPLVTVLIADTLKSNTMEGYGGMDKNDKLITASMDNIQSSLKCCGAYNATDWNDSNWMKKQDDKTQLPASCCDGYEPGKLKCSMEAAHDLGCAEALYLMLDKKMVLVGISVGGVLLVQLLISICGCKVNGGFANKINPL